MGISEREYQEMLRRNEQLAVIGGDSAERASKRAERPVAASVRPYVPTEHEEQCALFAWAAAMEAQRPELALMLAIPNGGYRPMATAAMLKAEGVKAGYPDIVLDVARGRWHGLRIELKRADRSNHATPEQRDWLTRLEQHGYRAVVCYGAQAAIDTILAYLAQEGGG